eukprot:Seg1135.2 transcript_id=Seg1135.2/GoldUCD/mRNA.D3Y31 product="hypothetical protein" protein_id=Seg1135.2/GoldUCD/D3Y31
MEISLPQDKLTETKQLVDLFASRPRATKHQLQQLAGELNWACRVVYGGRTFLRRILDCMNLLVLPNAKYQLTPEFRKDIFWWKNFLSVFNGKRLLHSKIPIADVQTDACNVAVGAFYRGDWAYSFLPADAPSLTSMHINFKEAYAIYLAVKCWGALWANQHVFVKSDNQAAVAMIKGTTANPQVMAWLRDLLWLSAIYNFRITAAYIPGIQNICADSVSRMHTTASLLIFYSLLCNMYPPVVVLSSSLMDHMSYNSSVFLLSRFCSGSVVQGAC